MGRGRLRSLVAPFVLALAAPSPAQDVQLSGFAGWRFGGSGLSPITAQNIDIAGARSFGAAASLALWGGNAVELSFSRAEGEAQPLFEAEKHDLVLSYLQLGFVHELDARGIRPFVGVALGGVRLRQGSGEARTLFSLGAVIGGRVFPTPHVGLRADGRLLMVFDERSRSRRRSTLDSGFTVGGDSIIQAELSVGLILAF